MDPLYYFYLLNNFGTCTEVDMGATKGIEGAWVRRKTTREGVGVGKGLVVL